MLSRVAERTYWFGRYMERIENTARLMTVNAQLLLDLPRGVRLGWESLVDITRITSYNVCYTKLLRSNVPQCGWRAAA